MNNSFRIIGFVTRLALALAISCSQLISAPLQTFAATATAGELSFQQLPVSFIVPTKWRMASRETDTIVLVPDTAQPDSALVIHIGIYPGFDPLWGKLDYTIKNELTFKVEQVLEPPGAITLGGKAAISMILTGTTAQGEAAGLGFRGILSDTGLGIGVLALAPANRIRQIIPTVDSILASTRFGMFTADRAAVISLIGSWTKSRAKSSGNQNDIIGGTFDMSSTILTFSADGTYRYRYESFLSIGINGGSREKSGYEEDWGQFYVVQGQLFMVSPKRGSNAVDAQIQGNYLQIGDAYYSRR